MIFRGRTVMDNIKIAICNCDIISQKRIQEDISSELEKYGYTYEIDKFPIDKIMQLNRESVKEYHILFIDIGNYGNGIQMVENIRCINENAIIVCLAENIEYAIDAYRVSAMRFVLKERLDELLPECMQAIGKQLTWFIGTKKYRFIEGEKLVRLNQIKYIENRGHCQFFALDSDGIILHMYYRMDMLEDELDRYGFIRIHKSYLVNIAKISRVKNYRVQLSTGEELPIPREKYMDIKKKILKRKNII